MAFYEALRSAVGRYAAGVHYLAPPASASALRATEARLGCPIPAGYRDFLLSFDGLTLFLEAQVIFACDQITRADRPVDGSAPTQGWLLIGDTPDGCLYLDGAGRVYLADDGAPDPILAGSDIDAWLNATMAREALVVDREGEFRDVFGDDGLDEAVRRKRAKAGQKHDPGSALYLLELAELSYEEDDGAGAQALLQQAVAIDPQAGPAWELLAALYQSTGQLAGAEHAALQAATATWHGPLRAGRYLQAARACPERATQHARAAWQADPQLAERLATESEQHLQAGELPEAQYLSDQLQLLLDADMAGLADASLVQAARQRLDALLKQVRTRNALRTI